MRSLKEQVGSDYSDQVVFYLVGTSPFETVEMLDEDREEKGLSWPVAYPDDGMLDALNINRQASKIAISGDGTITHRYGTGRGDYESWTALFDDISAN